MAGVTLSFEFFVLTTVNIFNKLTAVRLFFNMYTLGDRIFFLSFSTFLTARLVILYWSFCLGAVHKLRKQTRGKGGRKFSKWLSREIQIFDSFWL